MIPNPMVNSWASFYPASTIVCSLSPPWNSFFMWCPGVHYLGSPHTSWAIRSPFSPHTPLSGGVSRAQTLDLFSVQTHSLADHNLCFWFYKNLQTEDFRIYTSSPNLSSDCQVGVFNCLHGITCSKFPNFLCIPHPPGFPYVSICQFHFSSCSSKKPGSQLDTSFSHILNLSHQ